MLNVLSLSGTAPPQQRGPSSQPNGMPQAARAWYAAAYRLLLKKLQECQQLVIEYQQIVNLDEIIPHKCNAALDKSIAGKNRYTNVLPYDYNRVRLAGDSGAAGYINASLVQYTTPSTPHCTYIATQGPLAATAADFWQMVFDVRSPAIVMLGNTIEDGIPKCAQYFPVREGDVIRARDLEVKLKKHQALDAHSVCRSLVIKRRASGESHTLSHYQYHGWPDHGVPLGTGGIRAISGALDPVRGAGPVVVHCSAGIGRSGTFCAVDILRQRLRSWQLRLPASDEEMEGSLDLFTLVHQLRQQRMGMVQTMEQYCYCYNALKEELQDLLRQ